MTSKQIALEVNHGNGAFIHLLKRLEWSGEECYDDGCILPSCPICGGWPPMGNDVDDAYRGHQDGCELDKCLSALENEWVASGWHHIIGMEGDGPVGAIDFWVDGTHLIRRLDDYNDL